MAKVLYTVGHSTHTLDRLCDLLSMHGVAAIADVRSIPYSRRNPQFNRDCLEDELLRRGIEYGYLGAELGARPLDDRIYEEGRVRYDRLARTAEFQRGLDRVSLGADRYRLALLCAEADPVQCHRTILVSRHLKDRGFEIHHIIRQGQLESQNALEQRLMQMHGLANGDLFLQGPERLSQAYRLQERAIAYSSSGIPKHLTAASQK